MFTFTFLCVCVCQTPVAIANPHNKNTFLWRKNNTHANNPISNEAPVVALPCQIFELRLWYGVNKNRLHKAKKTKCVCRPSCRMWETPKSTLTMQGHYYTQFFFRKCSVFLFLLLLCRIGSIVAFWNIYRERKSTLYFSAICTTCIDNIM